MEMARNDCPEATLKWFFDQMETDRLAPALHNLEMGL